MEQTSKSRLVLACLSPCDHGCCIMEDFLDYIFFVAFNVYEVERLFDL